MAFVCIKVCWNEINESFTHLHKSKNAFYFFKIVINMMTYKSIFRCQSNKQRLHSFRTQQLGMQDFKLGALSYKGICLGDDRMVRKIKEEKGKENSFEFT